MHTLCMHIRNRQNAAEILGLLARSLGGFGVELLLIGGRCRVVLGNLGPWDPVLDSTSPVGFWPQAPNRGRPSFCWNGCVNLTEMCGVRSSVLLGAADFLIYFNKASHFFQNIILCISSLSIHQLIPVTQLSGKTP